MLKGMRVIQPKLNLSRTLISVCSLRQGNFLHWWNNIFGAGGVLFTHWPALRPLWSTLSCYSRDSDHCRGFTGSKLV